MSKKIYDVYMCGPVEFGPKQFTAENVTESLHQLQKCVDGYIECVYLFDNGKDFEDEDYREYSMICNEEGLIREMPYLLTIEDTADIYGPAVIGVYNNEGDLCEFTEEDIVRIESYIIEHITDREDM